VLHKDGSLKIWNIGRDAPLSTIFEHDEKVLGLAVNAEFLVAGGSDQLLRTYRQGNQNRGVVSIRILQRCSLFRKDMS
jgi:WD40 repeat protein